MFRSTLAVLSIVSATILSACTGATVSFSPYSSVDAPPAQVTSQAIEIRPGDRKYLTKASPKVLGWVSSQGEPGDPAIVEAAKVEAAKRGGTHILLRGSEKELSVDNTPLLPGTQIDESLRATYVVLRVSPGDWGGLPDVLQPKALTAPSVR